MISSDRTFCVASTDGRCINRDCWRWITSSLVRAFERDGVPMKQADLFDDCAIKKVPAK